MVIFWNDGTSLYHYGIPGMKWGVRNGPPYPLGSEQKTKREKNEDYQDKYYEKQIDSRVNNFNRTKGISDKKSKFNEIIHSKEFKTAVKIGAAVVVAYAGYKYFTDMGTAGGRLHYALKAAFTSSSKEEFERKFNKMEAEWFDKHFVDPIDKRHPGFYRSFIFDPNNPTDYQNSMKFLYGDKTSKYYDTVFNSSGWNDDIVNTLLDGNNPGWLMSIDTSSNCRMCTSSLIARLKGYDVCANYSHCGFSDGILSHIWNGAKTVNGDWTTKEEVLNAILSKGNNRYGDVSLLWKSGGGHSIAYVVKDNVVHFIDGQAGREYNVDQLMDYIDISKFGFTDLTDCTPNMMSLPGMLLSRHDRLTTKPRASLKDLSILGQKTLIELTALVSNKNAEDVVRELLNNDPRFI